MDARRDLAKVVEPRLGMERERLGVELEGYWPAQARGRCTYGAGPPRDGHDDVGPMIGAGAVTWSLVTVSAVLGLVFVLLVGAWLVGRLTIDVGWGRSRHPLGPMDIIIEAPRELVFDVVASPYLGRTPRELRGRVEILERGADLVVAAHHTRLSLLTSTTVESVRFEAPERISFRLLRGVAPSVTEEFTFDETNVGTVLAYRGELAMDFWILGRLAGRFLVKRTWERVVRRHLGDVKAVAEERARRRNGRDP